jgi:putative tricarboxylic transport membrane protein
MSRRSSVIGAALAGMFLAIVAPAAAAAADKYPSRAVTVVHGFKPGGGSDQLAQVTQPFLEKVLGQRFVNVYKPGADGAIAWKEVGKMTQPDGYTLTTCLTPKTQLNAIVNSNSGYTMADFEPVANVVFDPGVLVVAADSKFKTFQELIDAAKKEPGKLRMSHSGNGGDDWFGGVLLSRLTGAKFNLVPFDGDAPAWQAAAGGHVEASTNNVGVVSGLVKGGKLRALAVYTEKRLAAFPDVPTLKELGVNLVEGSYRGYLAPKGTPKEVVETLAKGLETVSKDPQFQAAVGATNMVPEYMGTEKFKAFIAEKQEALKKIAAEMKLVN